MIKKKNLLLFKDFNVFVKVSSKDFFCYLGIGYYLLYGGWGGG